jgi:transposase
MQMNSVGIDVSKGKSTVAIMRPFGEIVSVPFDVTHTADDLQALVDSLKSLSGETRVVMEYTGRYFEPIANYLREAGLFVSVVHAMLVHNYGKESIRRVKTDKADAIRIAGYGLDKWAKLTPYTPEDEARSLLKNYSRQYNHYIKLKVMLKNNFIALLDQTFPGLNNLFASKPRKDGHEKWVDFAAAFWHCGCIGKLTERVFKERYRKWCLKAGYNFSDNKAETLYTEARNLVATLPQNDSVKGLVTLAVTQLNTINETLAATHREMLRLASTLPEYDVVMEMRGVGVVLGPQLMAEIGDVRRFERKQSLIAFAGIDAPPYQSGSFESNNRRISKRGSPALRKALFQVMDVILKTAPVDNPIFQYLDKKRSEGKHYYVYMMAGANKFLRIYFARVKERLGGLAG